MVWAPSSKPKYLMTSAAGQQGKIARQDDVTGRRSGQRVGNAGQVGNNGFDTVALALNLRLKALHLVAVEGVGDIARNVDGRHVGQLMDEEKFSYFGRRQKKAGEKRGIVSTERKKTCS